MTTLTLPQLQTKPTVVMPPLHYPDSDGKPMSDNTKQFRYIVTIKEGLETLLPNPDIFVAGDLLWYPQEGNNTLRQAPDAMVVFGRPKGDRGSYMQWKEDNVAPQVVFEILSPGNTKAEMAKKFQFYQKYGVEEYYVYDPDRGRLQGWLRQGQLLTEIAKMTGWVSPRLGVRFELKGLELQIYDPQGELFLTHQELTAQRNQAKQQQQKAEERQHQAEQQQRQAEQVAQAEMAARQQAEQVAQVEMAARQQAEQVAQVEMAARQQAEQQLQQALAELEQLKRVLAQRED